jgi:predicted nucleic-acid-binding protein
MLALDTNVLVRYLVQDDAVQSAKAAQAIEALTPNHPGFISCIVLCEVNWVLKTAYKLGKKERIEILQRILSVSVFEIERLACCAKALRRYGQELADFSDYLIHEIAKEAGYPTVLTFDANAQKSEGFRQP